MKEEKTNWSNVIISIGFFICITILALHDKVDLAMWLLALGFFALFMIF